MTRWDLDDLPPAPAPIPLLVMVERSRDVDFVIALIVEPRGPKEETDGPCPTCSYSGHYATPPYYTNDIAAAWTLVEHMQTAGCDRLAAFHGLWRLRWQRIMLMESDEAALFICSTFLTAWNVS